MLSCFAADDSRFYPGWLKVLPRMTQGFAPDLPRMTQGQPGQPLYKGKPDSHRRRKGTAACGSCNVSSTSKRCCRQQPARASGNSGGGTLTVRGGASRPPSAGARGAAEPELRPGSAAGARNEHEQSFNYSQEATCIFHVTRHIHPTCEMQSRCFKPL